MVASANGFARRPALLAVAATCALAALVYGSLYGYGYEWGDMGFHAQTTLQVLRGAAPTDHQGYGPLWYYASAALFALFGVRYDVLLAEFYALNVGAALLLLLTGRVATSSWWWGLTVAALFILVPSFLASTIRDVAIAINVLPMLLYARAERGREARPLMLWAAIIGATFLLRPDFAYFFLAALWVLAAARGVADGAGLAAVRSILIGTLVAGAVVAVAVMLAGLRGFGGALLAQIVDYPSRLLFFVLQGLGLQTGAAGSPSLLRPVPLHHLWTGSPAERNVAFLIYSSSALLFGAGFALAARWLWPGAPRWRLLVPTAAFLAAGSSWPVFFLFRPGWVHFVSFMHAYWLLAAVLAVSAVARWREGGAIDRCGAAALLLFLALQAALFVFEGVRAPGLGILAERQGRTELVEAPERGVRVWTTPAERQFLETALRTIQSRTNPNEPIVCVPYCAGLAFLAGRDLLFREFFVDDFTPTLYPGWLDRAIALTRERRPPVIIVLDWGPNGTESSRFAVWAARYMEMVRADYRARVPIPGGTIYLRDAPGAEPRVAEVQAYGPASAEAGVPFNPQPDGSSAVWIRLPGLTAAAFVELDGRRLQSTVAGDVISAVVPAALLESPGTRWLTVADPGTNLTTRPIPLEVRAAPSGTEEPPPRR